MRALKLSKCSSFRFENLGCLNSPFGESLGPKLSVSGRNHFCPIKSIRGFSLFGSLCEIHPSNLNDLRAEEGYRVLKLSIWKISGPYKLPLWALDLVTLKISNLNILKNFRTVRRLQNLKKIQPTYSISTILIPMLWRIRAGKGSTR